MEIWKPTKYKGYEVSNLGNVRSIDRVTRHKDGKETTHRSRILKQGTSPKGYKKVYPTVDGKKFSDQVHRLVAEAFIPNPDNKPQVNHINGIKDDNRAENLEWVTNLENHMHKLENGLYPDSHLPKRVGQYTMDDDLVRVYSSIYEAAKSVGTTQYNVSRAVNGIRKSCKGFVWKYV